MRASRLVPFLATLLLSISASAQGGTDSQAMRLAGVQRLTAGDALLPVDPRVTRAAAIQAIQRESGLKSNAWSQCAGALSSVASEVEAFTKALGCVEPSDRRDEVANVAARAMLALVDQGRWLTPSDFAPTAGGPAGIGLTLRQGDDAIVVIRASRNSPAAAAALRGGDIVTAIDGNPVTGLLLDAVVAGLRGSEGSTVTLSVRRGDTPAHDVALRRAVLTSDRVPWIERRGSALVIAIPALSNGMTKAVEAAIEREKSGLTAIVLDLRDNGGGLLAEAASLADLFLDRADMFSQRGRTPSDVETLRAAKGQVAPGIPIAVAVNHETAAGAELVAAALQDNKRVLVVGELTAGAGTVQTLIPITGGYAARLTTSYLIRANGKRLADEPVTPDCNLTGDPTALIDRAIAVAATGSAACGADPLR